MEKEFKLSEKIKFWQVAGERVIIVEDIKEFIKRLKEYGTEMWKMIDELAGDL